jgi:hypothetical protein
MISAVDFFSLTQRVTRPPDWIFCWTLSPFRRCSAWERLGSIFTSQVQTLSRVVRPKVRRN